jgi:hypothetical protein
VRPLPQWVRVLIHRFNGGGIDALTWHPWMGRGRAGRFKADVLQDIAEVAISSPVALVGMTRWSLSKLRRLPGRAEGRRVDQPRVAARAAASAARCAGGGPRPGRSPPTPTSGVS